MKNGLRSTSSHDWNGISFAPSAARQPRITTPYLCFSHFFAIAPAATRTTVSRAEARPPPRASRAPYFCQYV